MRIGIAGCLVGTLLASTASAAGPGRTITVDGVGEAAGAPSHRVVWVIVHGRGDTEAEAVAARTAAEEALAAAARGAGAVDARSTSPKLAVIEGVDGEGHPMPRPVDAKSTVEVDLGTDDQAERPLAALADAVKRLERPGVDLRLFEPFDRLLDPAAAASAARVAAIADARRRAEDVARALGAGVGPVVAVTLHPEHAETSPKAAVTATFRLLGGR
jgi:hypothetical protein